MKIKKTKIFSSLTQNENKEQQNITIITIIENK